MKQIALVLLSVALFSCSNSSKTTTPTPSSTSFPSAFPGLTSGTFKGSAPPNAGMADWLELGYITQAAVFYQYTGGSFDLTLTNGSYDTSWNTAGVITAGLYYTMKMKNQSTGQTYTGTIGKYAPTGKRNYYMISVSNSYFKSTAYVDSI